MVHGRSEQRESSAGQRSHERIGRDGAVCVHEVNVDDVAQPLQENQEDPGSGRYAGDDLRYPGNMRVGCPGEPEQADWEQEGADDHRDQSLFGYRLSAVGFHLLPEACVGCVDDDGDADDDADGDAEEREGADAVVPASHFLECDGVGFEEEVEDPVDDGHVDCYQDENWLERHHEEGTEEVFIDDFLHGDFVFVCRRMYCPVLRLEAYSCCLALQQHGCVGLGAYEACQDSEERGHDECDPGRPSPSQVALGDEATHDRSRHGPNERCAGEETKGEPSLDRTPEVRYSPSYYG